MSTEVLQYYVDEANSLEYSMLPIWEKYREVAALAHGFDSDSRIDVNHPDYAYVRKLLYVDAMNYKLQYLTGERPGTIDIRAVTLAIDEEIVEDSSLLPDLR